MESNKHLLSDPRERWFSWFFDFLDSLIEFDDLSIFLQESMKETVCKIVEPPGAGVSATTREPG